MPKSLSSRKTLPESTAWLFPEYTFGKISLRTHRHVVIERILERGTWREINWLFDTYGEKAVRDWVRQWGYRALTRRSFALWQLVLGIKRYRAPAWARAAKMDPW